MSDDEFNSPAKQHCLTTKVSELRKIRGSLKGRLTSFEKFVCKFQNLTLSNVQKAEISLRLEISQVLLQNYYEIQDKIDQLCDESELETNIEYREVFENQYFSAMAAAKCLLDSVSDMKTCSGSEQHKQGSIKLPQIKLPTFDGHYDDWLEYKNSYITMIHTRSDLNEIQKFHYLKSSLSGPALQVISSLEFTASNYTHAWDLLCNRFHNTRLLIHNHVKSLFSAPSITKESPVQIRKLIDIILRNLRSLNTLGEPTDKWDTLLIYIIISKLDTLTEREWENHKGSFLYNPTKDSHKDIVKLEDLISFLRNRADMLEMIHFNHTKNTSIHKNSDLRKLPQAQTHQTQTFVSTRNTKQFEKPARVCVLCSGNHALFSCIQFLNLSIKDRIKIVEDKLLCLNCLRAGHTAPNCMFGPCKQCSMKHNSLIHLDSEFSPKTFNTIVHSSSASPLDKSSISTVDSAMHSMSHASTNHTKDESIGQPFEHVLLSTALVEVAGKDNTYHTARVLLDSGSQHSIISESFLNRLNVPIIQSTMRISGVGHSVTHSNRSCDVNIRSKLSDFKIHIRCIVLPEITSSIPSRQFDYNSITIPKHIRLADPTFNLPSKIDILIGADKFWDLLEVSRFKLATGPYLQNSKIGWLLSGPIQAKNLYVNQVSCNLSYTLDERLRKFWELEELGSNETTLTDEERQCEELFIRTTKRDDNGRFLVRMPFKESPEALGDSYEMAKGRFLTLERKLNRLPQLKKMYSDFLREYVNLGHMTRIESYDSPYFFLPHHGVWRENSTTTKLRVVFDASASTTSNKSLNDIQLIGPALQNDIFSILLRFRQYRYVACADVEKMFRQILIQDDQRNLQLILWRENPSDPLQIYRLNTVTYGTASAPYLSMRCIRHLAEEVDDEIIANIIKNDFYVDDLITGHDDLPSLLKICDKTSQVLQRGCFHLRKWTFNHNVSEFISKQLAIGEHCQNKTLGLGWLSDRDDFYFTTELENTPQVTKRTILSVISQIYDPLGLLSPTVIIAKMLLQKLWLQKLDWDNVVPNNILLMWNRLANSISHNLSALRIPRYVMGEHTQIRELHIFTDASQDAYGACAYIKTFMQSSRVSVKLLCSKGKVAPVKTVTIPRLELCAAVLGAKLYNKIIKTLRLKFDKVFFWTDSTIVLGWIKTSPRSLKTFVQNRVIQINELTSDALWRHVNSKDNPADYISRGLYMDDLRNCDIWWNGPEFLQQINLNYNINTVIEECTFLPEIKSQSHTITCVTSDLNDVFNFSNFSSFNRLKRAGAYVIRFIANSRLKCKDYRKIGPLSVDELHESEMLLTRLAQIQSFGSYNTLVKDKRYLSKISGLNLFLDEKNIIRVGGRLNNSDFSYNKKHPILLCSKHKFTILLFISEHKRLLHAGPLLLLSCLRESWWPLGGRNLARKTVHQCVKCSRMKGASLRPIMGNLPAERLEASYPFKYCGVDYAGPVMILNRKGRGAKLIKSYICLFVCFCTRAIHLELVTSLSTNDYLLALKRFISRRGKPVEIISDNGKNFVGAEREFQSFLNENSYNLVDCAADIGIKFRFIPPYSPHFGGLWEAGVKSCKYHLRRVVGNAHLTYEELSTVLAQIEAVLNSRPISVLSSNPYDAVPLTPSHFLIGRPLTAPVQKNLTDVPSHRLLRYDRVEQLRQHFWQRWAKEYVTELQNRTKWKANTSEIKVDTIVLIKDDNLPPLMWKLGRIIRVYPGKDGVSRVADIRTASGTVQRAFSKICPLPVSTE